LSHCLALRNQANDGLDQRLPRDKTLLHGLNVGDFALDVVPDREEWIGQAHLVPLSHDFGTEHIGFQMHLHLLACVVDVLVCALFKLIHQLDYLLVQVKFILLNFDEGFNLLFEGFKVNFQLF
jgi:hypothetical protein